MMKLMILIFLVQKKDRDYPQLEKMWFLNQVLVFTPESRQIGMKNLNHIWDFGLIKAIKSSFAGVLVSIVPILIAWIILLGGFISLVFLMIMIFTMLGASENIFMSYVLIFSCMIVLAAYIASLFSFQFITYKDIFKSIIK